MKTIQDQRIYIGTTDFRKVVEKFDLYLDGNDDDTDTTIGGPSCIPVLKAGENTLAIVLNENWARELVELLETFHVREQKYLDEIARLSDEVGALRLEQSQAKVLSEVRERLGAL